MRPEGVTCTLLITFFFKNFVCLFKQKKQTEKQPQKTNRKNKRKNKLKSRGRKQVPETRGRKQGDEKQF